MTPEQEAEFLRGCTLIEEGNFKEGTDIITPVMQACWRSATRPAFAALLRVAGTNSAPYVEWMFRTQEGVEHVNNLLGRLKNDSK